MRYKQTPPTGLHAPKALYLLANNSSCAEGSQSLFPRHRTLYTHQDTHTTHRVSFLIGTSSTDGFRIDGRWIDKFYETPIRQGFGARSKNLIF